MYTRRYSKPSVQYDDMKQKRCNLKHKPLSFVSEGWMNSNERITLSHKSPHRKMPNMNNQLIQAIATYVAHLQTLTGDTVQYMTGRKYGKVSFKGQWQNSVHSFIDLTTGDLLKAATFRAPAKGARFNLLSDLETIKQVADPYGSYLYRR